MTQKTESESQEIPCFATILLKKVFPCHSKNICIFSKSFYEADDTEIYNITGYVGNEDSISILLIRDELLMKVPVSM